MNKLHWIVRRYLAEEDGSGTSGGGSAAPAPAAETNDAGGVDWGDMNSDVTPGSDEDGDEEGVVPDPDAPEGTDGHEDDDLPADESTTDEDPAEQTATPIQPAEPQQTPEEAAAAQKKLEEDFVKWEQAQIAQLTKDYGFDEDTASRLQTEPELVLPELAAQMHMKVMKQVVETVQRMMPGMVQPVLAQTNTEAKANELFYSANNDLNPKQHHDKVIEAAKLYRKMNPKATPDEAVKGIGEIVRLTLGLKTQPKAKAAPAGKAKGAPHRPPAAGGRGGAASASKAKPASTVWSELAEDDD